MLKLETDLKEVDHLLVHQVVYAVTDAGALRRLVLLGYDLLVDLVFVLSVTVDGGVVIRA